MQKKYWLLCGFFIFALGTACGIPLYGRCLSESEECASWQVELLSKQVSLGADSIISIKLNRKTYFDENFKVILSQSNKVLTIETYQKLSSDDKLIIAAPIAAVDLIDFQAGPAKVEVIQYIEGKEAAHSPLLDLTLQ